MKSNVGAILLLGFGTLVALVAVLGISTYHRAEAIEAKISAIHERYRQSAVALAQTKADTFLSGIMIRDYILDPSPDVGPRYKQKLFAIRASLGNHLASLRQLTDRDEGKFLERLNHELDVYWDLLNPVFEWTPKQKAELASSFLRQLVIPRRNTILSIMGEIDDLSARTFKNEQEIIQASRLEFQAYLPRMIVLCLVLAIGVAIISIIQVSALDRRSENQRLRAENAEDGLRRLSQQLVQAQEEERKSISRELHDEIGQMLTGLKMELANLEEFRNSSGGEFENHLAETRGITEQTMRSVRDLAMGLRPSMLDDLGLAPALNWQAHEFSRRSGIAVSIETDGELEHLSESLRTCVYRIVQESLTNCARHAEAGNVWITLHGIQDRISLKIHDDGKGFNRKEISSPGLGLIGMEERVKKLGGTLAISSRQGESHKGTILTVELPVALETSS
jgi:signal transduction histidine kinase